MHEKGARKLTSHILDALLWRSNCNGGHFFLLSFRWGHSALFEILNPLKQCIMTPHFSKIWESSLSLQVLLLI